MQRAAPGRRIDSRPRAVTLAICGRYRVRAPQATVGKPEGFRNAKCLLDVSLRCRDRAEDRHDAQGQTQTNVTVAGRWVYLYRAVDGFGQVIDVYASTRRDGKAARRFFQPARTRKRRFSSCCTTGTRHRDGRGE
jgi:DDE domain